MYDGLTTRDPFKDCILARKSRIQMHIKFKKGKVPQAVSRNFAKKGCSLKICSVKNLFLYLRPKFLKNAIKVVHT